MPRVDGGPDPRALEEMDLEAHLADPALQPRYVRAVFDLAAPRYDRFTRRFSLGMDRRWKRELAALAAPHAAGARLVVDLACGTGDLARAMIPVAGRAIVLGVDVSRRMLRLAAARPGVEPSPSWCAADLLQLPLADGSVDLLTAGYAVRNAAEWGPALDEMARVLEPGGLALTLDFFKPRLAFWRRLFLWYLHVAGRLFGSLWHGAPAVYGYIAPSVARFVTAEEFARGLEARGLEVVASRLKLGGGIGLHVARKVGGPVISPGHLSM